MDKHIMIDIETLSIKDNAFFPSLGACIFDLEGNIHRTLYLKFSWENFQCRAVDPETVTWWLAQSKGAQEELLRDNGMDYDLYSGLKQLALLIEAEDPKYIWAQGPTFDLNILANAYNQINVPLPWNRKNERDVRTCGTLIGKEFKKAEWWKAHKKDYPELLNEYTEHNPLQDTLVQAMYVAWVYGQINYPYEVPKEA